MFPSPADRRAGARENQALRGLPQSIWAQARLSSTPTGSSSCTAAAGREGGGGFRPGVLTQALIRGAGRGLGLGVGRVGAAAVAKWDPDAAGLE